VKPGPHKTYSERSSRHVARSASGRRSTLRRSSTGRVTATDPRHRHLLPAAVRGPLGDHAMGARRTLSVSRTPVAWTRCSRAARTANPTSWGSRGRGFESRRPDRLRGHHPSMDVPPDSFWVTNWVKSARAAFWTSVAGGLWAWLGCGGQGRAGDESDHAGRG
jgi:hypothetical protein